VAGLVALLHACLDGSMGGADELLPTLVSFLEADPPTTAEMVRAGA
jgi:hypothetical protein